VCRHASTHFWRREQTEAETMIAFPPAVTAGRLTLEATLAFAAQGTTTANEGKAVAEEFNALEGAAAEPEAM
jgi:hypothetical protein